MNEISCNDIITYGLNVPEKYQNFFKQLVLISPHTRGMFGRHPTRDGGPDCTCIMCEEHKGYPSREMAHYYAKLKNNVVTISEEFFRSSFSSIIECLDAFPPKEVQMLNMYDVTDFHDSCIVELCKIFKSLWRLNIKSREDSYIAYSHKFTSEKFREYIDNWPYDPTLPSYPDISLLITNIKRKHSTHCYAIYFDGQLQYSGIEHFSDDENDGSSLIGDESSMAISLLKDAIRKLHMGVFDHADKDELLKTIINL